MPTVERDAYRTLLEDRRRVNIDFSKVPVSYAGVDALPEAGVPAQITECAVHMPEAANYSAVRAGPGAIRDPLHAADAEDDAEDELQDEDEASADSAGQPAASERSSMLNEFETPLGLDLTAVPDILQQLQAHRAQVHLVHDALKRTREPEPPDHHSAAQPAPPDDRSAAQPGRIPDGPDDDADVGAATARAAKREELFISVVDLRALAQKLNQHDFVAKLKHLDDVEEGKALHVRAGKPMNMFDPGTWSKCMAEFWFWDALPNDD